MTPPRGLRVPRAYLLGFALATAIGLLLTGYKVLGRVASGEGVSLAGPLVEELGASWAAFAAVPAIVALTRRCPLNGEGWARRIPAHLVGVVLFGLFHTSAMWASRTALFPLLGMGAYDYGRMPVRYAMEFPQQVIVFAIVVAIVHYMDRDTAARERELHVARLETELVRTRLDALRMQLNPHFLFNALNTVSSVMYESRETADRVLARLSDLLRRSVGEGSGHEVTLRHEVETLELYLDVMRARFGDRLEVDVNIDAGAMEAHVPPMILQPLVENAIEHGLDPDGGSLSVRVTARAAGAGLEIEVRDTGSGAGPGEIEPRVGLGNTAERLRNLYGADHDLEVAGGGEGGFRVRFRIPWRAEASEGGGDERAPGSAAEPSASSPGEERATGSAQAGRSATGDR